MRFKRGNDGRYYVIDEKTGKKHRLTIPEPGQSLAVKYPHLLPEWHPTKNLPLTPNDITAGSGVKVWWICKHGHEWETRATTRAWANAGCPYCVAASTSYGEQFIYWSFKQLFPDQDNTKQVLNRDKINKLEFDVVISPLNLYIEYSSDYWHSQERRKKKDQEKRDYCKEKNINYIEIIERSKPFELSLEPNYIQYYREEGMEALKKIVEYISNQFNLQISNIDFTEVNKQATEYSKGAIEYKDSLEYLHPELAEEWDYEKNGDLDPSEVKITSNRRIYWRCKKHGHSWEATITNRVNNNTGCPYCSNRKVLKGYNDLATTHPELAKEWDVEKNEELKATDIVVGSNEMIWWRCGRCNHSWQAAPAKRHYKTSGCPVCAGRYQDSLAVTHPKIAALWHPTLNGDLTPNDVTAGSWAEIFWKRPHGKAIKRRVCDVVADAKRAEKKAIKGYKASDFW